MLLKQKQQQQRIIALLLKEIRYVALHLIKLGMKYRKREKFLQSIHSLLYLSTNLFL